ncbi:MliC family protein [Testudinibacter sp. P80/BLE/0925]|uniref:MliC family protein n=1 Tax=Testudinibacter sp. TW-1 TaxID=3417757 RepID=UPI003D366684
MLKPLLFSTTLLFLSACQYMNAAPQTLQPIQQSTSASSVSNKTLPSQNVTYIYHCANETEIKVVVLNALAIQQHSKNPSIQLTFKGVSQHLQPIVSDSGKRYANIQWNWWEKSESAVLSNSLGEVIVKGCVRE